MREKFPITLFLVFIRFNIATHDQIVRLRLFSFRFVIYILLALSIHVLPNGTDADFPPDRIAAFRHFSFRIPISFRNDSLHKQGEIFDVKKAVIPSIRFSDLFCAVQFFVIP